MSSNLNSYWKSILSLPGYYFLSSVVDWSKKFGNRLSPSISLLSRVSLLSPCRSQLPTSWFLTWWLLSLGDSSICLEPMFDTSLWAAAYTLRVSIAEGLGPELFMMSSKAVGCTARISIALGPEPLDAITSRWGRRTLLTVLICCIVGP